MTSTLAEHVTSAQTRWPGIAVDVDALRVLLDERGFAEPPPYVAELALARAALGGDPVATRALHAEMFGKVDKVLGRLGVSAADVDDIKQDIKAKLLLGDAKLSQYQGTGPLAQWIASIAGREALGSMRKRKPTDELEDDDVLDTTDDPHLLALKTQHGAAFKQAFQAAVAELAPRDRAILKAIIVDGRTVTEVATVYRVNRVTASRWLSEIRMSLLKGTRSQLRAQRLLDEQSLESAIRLIDSNLDLSLYRVLGSAA